MRHTITPKTEQLRFVSPNENWEPTLDTQNGDIMLDTGVILKRIPHKYGYGEKYLAGSDGNIYSQKIYSPKSKKPPKKWEPLKPYRKSKYPQVTVSFNNKKSSTNIHRLICLAFHGLPESPELQVRHLDSNPQNSVPKNLAWGNSHDQWTDMRNTGRYLIGDTHPKTLFKSEDKEKIRWCIDNKISSIRNMARCLRCSEHVISDIVNKR